MALPDQLIPFYKKTMSFKVIYHTHSPVISPSTRRLCILDSSFNPPHLGHYALVNKSITYPYHGQVMPKDSVGVLLMFSVNNCDKKTPKPAPFEHRVQMMCLLADHIKQEMDVPVYVIVTDQPIFADKSVQVQQWIKQTAGLVEGLRLTFLLGFDTLVRVFDNKYYAPTPTTVALEGFMRHNDLFALTRDDDKEYSLEQQLSYVENIRSGKNKDCLPEWSERIFIGEGDPSLLKVSSSRIRALIESGDTTWQTETIPSIVEFIQESKPYE